MLRAVLISLLSLEMCFSAAIAVPRISVEQDVDCALEVYGIRVTEELDKKVEKEVNRVLTAARHRFGTPFSVIWGYGLPPQGIYIAGVTFPFPEDNNVILFNPIYLNKYRDIFISDVVTHELSHAIANKLFPDAKDSHGREWQYVMRQLGKVPKKYHNYTFCSEDDGRVLLPIIPSL